MNVEKEIREFIAMNLLYSDDEFAYSNDDSLLQRGIIDSLGVMEMVSFVRSQFRLNVPINDVTRENFDSVSGLARYIQQQTLAECRAAA